MNRELLEKPFDLSQIKQREGNFGMIAQAPIFTFFLRLSH